MNTILVFAPHPDDEIIGCGGYLASQQASGGRINVVVVTDGARGVLRGQSPDVRRRECLAGLECLAVRNVRFLDCPDGQVPLSGQIVDDILSIVRTIRPSEILLPSPTEHHPDHRRVTRLVLQVLEENWQGRLLFYETTAPTGVVNFQVDITPYFEKKIEALEAHSSQLSQFPYVEHSRNLARVRGIPFGVEFGEGFFVFDWDGSRQNFFETLPLISVIIRASHLDLVKHAFASLQQQEYDHFEVVLIWFGEDEPDLSPFHFLDVRFVKGQANRGINLNLGLDHARGDYVCFLDEDDIIYPQHLVTLLTELNGSPEVDIVYSGANVVSCKEENGMVAVERQLGELNTEISAGRLLLGNTIPIHSALYRASLFRVNRFAEDLVAYEDWEFVSRLQMNGYSFRHLGEITCEYRLYAAEGEGLEALARDHADKGYLPLRQKVLARIVRNMEIRHVEDLATLVTEQEDKVKELQQDIARQHARASSLEKEANDSRSLNTLLSRAFEILSIEKPGRDGVAELIGRSLPGRLLFSIVLPVHNTPWELLSEALQSVAEQAYPGWELCVVDDGSDKEDIRELLGALEQAPQFAGRLRMKRFDKQSGIVAASMAAVALGSAPYLVFLDHDDILHPEALLQMAIVLEGEKRYDLLYSDSRMIDRAGEVLNVYRKPDWSPETLLQINYINHLTVVSRAVFEEVGGLRSAFEGSQDWDLLLRLLRVVASENICHVREALYDWRAAESSVAYRGNIKEGAFDAGKRAVADHLAQLGYKGVRVDSNTQGRGLNIEWLADQPEVTAIIPTHDNLEGLSLCVDGLLRETEYPGLRIVVTANRVESPEMIDYLDSLKSIDQIRVLGNDSSFNWSYLNNEAIRLCETPLLLLLNDDVEVMEKDWLQKMVRYTQIEDVGAVGATLFYPGGSLQHNGISTDRKSIAHNIITFGDRNELSMSRNVSAVTGACQLITREAYDLCNGYDERLVVNYGDVDICLALRQMGLRVVQAADVQLVHHEMATRGPVKGPEENAEFKQAILFMREKWGEMLAERYRPSYEVVAQGTRILHIREG